ncbi:MAG: hypothetical protein ACREJ3_14665 [Polyangiaceae bacterium]
MSDAKSQETPPAAARDPAGDATVHTLGDTPVTTSASASSWVDCVGALHVVVSRGYLLANAKRLSESNPSVRATSRIADLAPSDVRAFCDWEACVRTNGYRHVCSVNDAGWERCRVCDGGADCDGLPVSEDDCVAHAGDTSRASCHVVLLEECLLQRAIRAPGDPRLTEACRLSEAACAGQLPGDLSAQAVAARRETDQVTAEECERELAISSPLDADVAAASYWAQRFSAWDGGLPSGDLDAPSD